MVQSMATKNVNNLLKIKEVLIKIFKTEKHQINLDGEFTLKDINLYINEIPVNLEDLKVIVENYTFINKKNRAVIMKYINTNFFIIRNLITPEKIIEMNNKELTLKFLEHAMDISLEDLEKLSDYIINETQLSVLKKYLDVTFEKRNHQKQLVIS